MKLRQKISALAPALMVLTLAASTAYAQEKRAGAAVAPTALTDGQILQIVRTLNDGEIKQAEEALDEGASDEVKKLADMLKTDHENSDKALDELLKGERNLEDSPADDMLKASAEETHERLQDLAGNQYDCAYINAQISQHEAALAMTKGQLTANAKAADVGKFLTTKTASLEHHLQMAKDSLGKVQGCSAAQPAQAPRNNQ